MEILHEFTNWITKNYSHTKGGYRHRGDFYRNDKPVNLQALKDRFINEKQSDGNLVKLKQADVIKSVCENHAQCQTGKGDGRMYCCECGEEC